MMSVKSRAKHLLQSILGMDNYLKLFHKYLITTSSFGFIGRIPYFEKKYADLNALRSHIHLGDHCIDVGANIGVYTVKMAQSVGAGGHVYAFEPMDLCYRVCKESIPNALWSNITLEKCIISDQEGVLPIALPIEQGVWLPGFSHVVSNNSEQHTHVENVKSISLDSYFEKRQVRISAIKIDVEGYEDHVIRSGIGLIQRDKPTILCEIHNTPNLLNTFKLIEEMGYRAYHVVNKQLQLLDKNQADWVTKLDYFFIPKNRA